MDDHAYIRRRYPIEVAVNIELQQDRWMVRGPASYLGSNPVKSQLRQIKLINKDIDHLDRIILVDPVFQTLGKQRALFAIRALNEALHLILQQPNQLLRESHEARRFHTTWVISGRYASGHAVIHVRFAPKADKQQIVSAFPLCARTGLTHRSKQLGYSITSSARASSVGGTSRPSAFAVLALMANSNFTVCWTGKPAGFSPLRIRPA